MADLAKDILDDSGYASRKYVALYVYWVLVTIGFATSIKWTEAAAIFPMYWAALSAGLAAYYGVNIGHAMVASKTPTADVLAEDDVLPKPPA